MSLGVNSGKLQNLESMIFNRELITTEEKLSIRPSDVTNKPNENLNGVAMNQYGNKAELQEIANLLQSKTAESEEDEEYTTSDKSTPTDIGSTLAKEGLYRYTGCKLLKPNPYLVAMTLLGVDFEEDGDALTKGAETGEIGNFAGDYKNYFKGMWDRADSVWNAAWEGFNLPANVISIGLQDSLQTIGAELSKVLGKEPVVFLGSGVSAVGTALNAMGDVAGDSIKGTVGIVKNLFTGNFDGVADSAEGIYNGVKDSVLDVTDAVVDVAKDGADLAVKAGEEAYDAAKEAGNAIADVAEEAWDGISDTAEEAGDAIADFAEDTWDEVEDFFDSIF